MKARAQYAVAVLVVVLVVAGAIAYAAPRIVDIGFGFVAGGKQMPAGKYEIVVGATGPVTLRGEGKDAQVVVLSVMTRLARHDYDQESELVFDRIGGVLHLSEVWIRGEDGYLVLGTKENHEHVVLGGPKAKK